MGRWKLSANLQITKHLQVNHARIILRKVVGAGVPISHSRLGAPFGIRFQLNFVGAQISLGEKKINVSPWTRLECRHLASPGVTQGSNKNIRVRGWVHGQSFRNIPSRLGAHWESHKPRYPARTCKSTHRTVFALILPRVSLLREKGDLCPQLQLPCLNNFISF